MATKVLNQHWLSNGLFPNISKKLSGPYLGTSPQERILNSFRNIYSEINHSKPQPRIPGAPFTNMV